MMVHRFGSIPSMNSSSTFICLATIPQRTRSVTWLTWFTTLCIPPIPLPPNAQGAAPEELAICCRASLLTFDWHLSEPRIVPAPCSIGALLRPPRCTLRSGALLTFAGPTVLTRGVLLLVLHAVADRRHLSATVAKSGAMLYYTSWRAVCSLLLSQLLAVRPLLCPTFAPVRTLPGRPARPADPASCHQRHICAAAPPPQPSSMFPRSGTPPHASVPIGASCASDATYSSCRLGANPTRTSSFGDV